MLGLSLGHLLILSVVVLLFGHRRLPELGKALGSGVGAFKKGLEGKGIDGKGIEGRELESDSTAESHHSHDSTPPAPRY